MESLSLLNDLDYIVIGIILLSGLLALMRGLTREIFSLVAWVGAYFAATKFYLPAVPLAHHYIKNDKAAEWAAMAAVFIVALIVLVVIGALICGMIKGRALTIVDRSLGFIYGLVRGGLVVCLIYLCAVMILWPDIDASPAEQQQNKDRNMPPEMLTEAKTRPILAYGANLLKEVVPKEMIDKTLQAAEKQKQETEKNIQQKALDTLSTPGLPNVAKPSQSGSQP